MSVADIPCVQSMAAKVITTGGVDMEPLGGRRDLVLPTLEKVCHFTVSYALDLIAIVTMPPCCYAFDGLQACGACQR